MLNRGRGAHKAGQSLLWRLLTTECCTIRRQSRTSTAVLFFQRQIGTLRDTRTEGR